MTHLEPQEPDAGQPGAAGSSWGTMSTMTEAAQYWDEQAASFDEAPDHGLRDPEVREAWGQLLLPLVPPASTVADIGCGTGSLSVLLAAQGHRVCGVDLAPRMVAAARDKAAQVGVTAEFVVGDAAAPPWNTGSFDVVLARHVLWAMADPHDTLTRWVELLRPGGRLLLVEGRWWTGGGLSAADVRELVLRHRAVATVDHLNDPLLWGGPINDERFLVVSTS